MSWNEAYYEASIIIHVYMYLVLTHAHLVAPQVIFLLNWMYIDINTKTKTNSVFYEFWADKIIYSI